MGVLRRRALLLQRHLRRARDGHPAGDRRPRRRHLQLRVAAQRLLGAGRVGLHRALERLRHLRRVRDPLLRGLPPRHLHGLRRRDRPLGREEDDVRDARGGAAVLVLHRRGPLGLQRHLRRARDGHAAGHRRPRRRRVQLRVAAQRLLGGGRVGLHREGHREGHGRGHGDADADPPRHLTRSTST
jgi:hypothetical protein